MYQLTVCPLAAASTLDQSDGSGLVPGEAEPATAAEQALSSTALAAAPARR
jgi:hypothetical protein